MNRLKGTEAILEARCFFSGGKITYENLGKYYSKSKKSTSKF